MNPGERIADADRHAMRMADTASRSSSIRDAFVSETVPYADLVLPDTTYLER